MRKWFWAMMTTTTMTCAQLHIRSLPRPLRARRVSSCYCVSWPCFLNQRDPPAAPGLSTSSGSGMPHALYRTGGPHSGSTLRAAKCELSARRKAKLWVLRSTLTLKTTDTTLVSVDGNIGHRGALVPLPHASPDTITEGTPSATVTPTQSHGRGKARQSSGPSPGTGVCHCSVAILKLQACANSAPDRLYLFGVFYNSGITQTLILERYWQLYNLRI